MKMLLLISVAVIGSTNLKAQWAVVDINAKIDRVIERITTATSQFKNMSEYKAIADAARALKKVSSGIKNSKKVMDCFSMVTNHAELYSKMYKSFMKDKNYTLPEKVQIKSDLMSYVRQSLDDFGDLKTAIIEGTATMNDKERFDLVDLVRTRLSDNYKKMYSFSRGIQSTSKLRATSDYERNNKVGLYGTKEKY